MDIKELLNRRTDLSTFLVHLTRDGQESSARENLESIIRNRQIEARSIFGHLKRRLENSGTILESQKTVCFTESPIEYTHLMLEDIENRQCRFAPYGIAITKRIGRRRGVNPIWYVDMTPGHDWLTQNLDRLAEQFRANQTGLADLASVFPFVEHMGNGPGAFGGGYRKEFWWEREWRYVGTFTLPTTIICMCPEDEIEYFTALLAESGVEGSCIDPRWSLEKIIAYLAGFSRAEIDII